MNYYIKNIKNTKNIIIFEGIDGTGKTTLINLLTNHFKEKNIPILKIQGLGITEIGKTLRNMFLRTNSLSPISKFFLSLGNMFEIQEKIIKPFIKNNPNGIIFIDRWLASNYAYQHIHYRNFKLIQKDINFNFLTPLITFHIHLEPSIALNRKRKQTNNKLDAIESKSLDYFQQVINGFGDFHNYCSYSLVKNLNGLNSIKNNFNICKNTITKWINWYYNGSLF